MRIAASMTSERYCFRVLLKVSLGIDKVSAVIVTFASVKMVLRLSWPLLSISESTCPIGRVPILSIFSLNLDRVPCPGCDCVEAQFVLGPFCKQFAVSFCTVNHVDFVF